MISMFDVDPIKLKKYFSSKNERKPLLH